MNKEQDTLPPQTGAVEERAPECGGVLAVVIEIAPTEVVGTRIGDELAISQEWRQVREPVLQPREESPLANALSEALAEGSAELLDRLRSRLVIEH